MCIRTETLDRSGLGSEAVNAETPLDVLLVLHVNDIPTVDSTAYSLTMKISPTCTKSFQLTAVTSVRFARCCSSRFAIASSAAPSVYIVWSEGGQREAWETMEVLKTLLGDVYHELLLFGGVCCSL